MAGRGRAPGSGAKPVDERRRRNVSPDLTVVTGDGKTHGSPLPDTHEWPAETLAWWETWRKCPQASLFTETDWVFLLDTAVLHADFWLGDRSVAAELRLRAAKFGATPEDRLRLKLSVGDPPAGVSGRSSPPRLQAKVKARRSRLLRAVGDVGGGEAPQ